MARKPPETTSDFLALLSDFFADSSDESIEEVEADLRAEGIDPEEVADTIEKLVQTKLNEYRLKWRDEAQQERADALARLERRSSEISDLPRDLKGSISTILAEMQQQQAQAYFNKLQKATEDDLRDIWLDLKRLQMLSEENDGG
jgi:hypothetical protein